MLPRFIGSMGPCRSVGPTMFRLSHLNVVAIIRRKKVRTDRRSPFTIILAEDEKQTLEGMARQYTSSYFQVIRSKIILLAAEGLTNKRIAERLDIPRQIVSKWRKRFFEDRLAGMEDQPRSGRPANWKA